MRLIVARCEVSYTGRLSARLAEGVRLLMIKEDGTVMLWSDGGGLSVKPLNRDLRAFRSTSPPLPPEEGTRHPRPTAAVSLAATPRQPQLPVLSVESVEGERDGLVGGQPPALVPGFGEGGIVELRVDTH